MKTITETCPHCHGSISVRNPSGFCDHLYYPDACSVCVKLETRRLRLENTKLLVENWFLQFELLKLKTIWVALKIRNESLRFIVWCLGGDPNA